MSPPLYSIGHSNHTLTRFLDLLGQHQIEALVDVRRFPGSRKFPHFGRENLASALCQAGIEYYWLEALGGRRHHRANDIPSLNRGLASQGFRNFADHMSTAAFAQAIERLLEIAGGKQTAIMCAEGLFWRCHRRLIGDFLAAVGTAVLHIMPTGKLRPHALTKGALIEGAKVTYPGENSLFAG
jgi:uncharacterized protein (DUF488 family)